MARRNSIGRVDALCRKAIPQEPPFDIRIHGAVGPARGLLQKMLEAGIRARPDDKNFSELIKTGFERRTIRESVRWLNAIRREYGLEAVDIPVQMVHVMDPAVFETYMRRYRGVRGRKPMPAGTTRFPHALMKRVADGAECVMNTTHEVVHLAAYTLFLFRADMDIGHLRFTADSRVDIRRSGLRVGDDGFLGLNEAITEYIARVIRQKMAESGGLSDRLKKKVIGFGTYEPQIAVLERVVRELFENQDYGMSIAIWDYFTGSNDFLLHIRRQRPEMIRPLRGMNGYEKSALETAKALGFTEEAREIRHMIKTGEYW